MDILIVDDDARIVELVAWFLDQRGYGVRRASSFTEARGLLAERRPDLMLSDIDLGAEDGREELWAIAREGGLPPTLVVSGYLSPEVLAELEGLPGLVGTLSKPFDFEVLEARIRACLEARGSVQGTAPQPIPSAARVHLPEVLVTPSEPLEDGDGWIEIQPGSPSSQGSPGSEGLPDAPTASPSSGWAGPSGSPGA